MTYPNNNVRMMPFCIQPNKITVAYGTGQPFSTASCRRFFKNGISACNCIFRCFRSLLPCSVIDLSMPLSAAALAPDLRRLWFTSAQRIRTIAARFDADHRAPVLTVRGRYQAQEWTEWTRGFMVGSALLQFDAMGDDTFLQMGRRQTRQHMESAATHFGVHDHGFTCTGTFGVLLRLMHEGRLPHSRWERAYYELALKVSGAVQARRWTQLSRGRGYIYSFNGPHSLFADTIRSLRALALAYRLGSVLLGEQDARVSLLDRRIQHARVTADHIVYYGTGRDGYDVPGRVAHEALFNVRSGTFRCPSTQQGYSPVTTWTRGLAWILCGFAELVEFVYMLPEEEVAPYGGHDALASPMLDALAVTSTFYLREMPACGVPYWDTGAPGLSKLAGYRERAADPFNDYEPVDSSAAAIAAQGLLRYGRYLGIDGAGARFWQAGLRITKTLLSDLYLNADPDHEGLLLHSVYHWPRRWDHVPPGRQVACGESVMWGDYHLRELALYLQRIEAGPYYAFWNVC